MAIIDFLMALHDEYVDQLHSTSMDRRFEIPKLKEKIAFIEKTMEDYKEKE